MKKFLVFILIGIIGLGLAAAAQIELPGARAVGFFAIYPILGEATSPISGVSVEDRLVIIYTPDEAGRIGTTYGYAYVKNGVFMINPFRNKLIEVGQTYSVAIPNDNPSDPSKGYGADPVTITISGLGFDRLSHKLVLALGAGPLPGPVEMEEAPAIKIWFNNRLYQPDYLAKTGEKFIVSDQPTIKLDITITDPYLLASDVSEYSIVLDPDSASPQTLDLQASDISKTIYAAGTAPTEQKISALSIEYELTEPLSEGEHVVAVTAKSSGAMGIPASITEKATVSVLGGPSRLIGTPITFPSPFSKTKHGVVTIQYQLSSDTAIQIILVDVSGKRIKNFMFEAGQEGGTAGINKVTWDGVTDRGTFAGNGIYVGTILARDEARKLGTVKLTIVD